MPVSGISSSSSAAYVQQPPPVTVAKTDANGDHTSGGAGRVKDGDGDYVSSSRPTAALASNSVQAAVASLKTGG
jgi:hypothetical protein